MLLNQCFLCRYTTTCLFVETREKYGFKVTDNLARPERICPEAVPTSDTPPSSEAGPCKTSALTSAYTKDEESEVIVWLN
jgi:hypothetical protein